MTDEPFITPSEARDASRKMADILRKAGPHVLGTTVAEYTTLIADQERISRWADEIERRRAAREGARG